MLDNIGVSLKLGTFLRSVKTTEGQVPNTTAARDGAGAKSEVNDLRIQTVNLTVLDDDCKRLLRLKGERVVEYLLELIHQGAAWLR